jgi:hypothetical protein
MSVWEHARLKIFNASQHPYTHDISEFSYTNPKLPDDIIRISDVLDYIVNVIYPHSGGTVATKNDLPLTAPANTYYFVKDDGDGHGAGYVYQIINGVGKWYKRYDVDWNLDHVLSETINRTQYLYPSKYGSTDKDENGNDITGTYAGQTFYGGDQAGQNLTLVPNISSPGGYIQFGGSIRPTSNTFDAGTAAIPFNKIYTNSLAVGSITISASNIISSGNAIGFGTNNLITTGYVTVGTLVSNSSISAGSLILTSGSITDPTGSISFGSCNLTTTGTITGATGSKFGNITIANGSITSTASTISFGSNNLITTGTVTAANISLTGGSLSTTNLTATTLSSGASNLTISANSGYSIIFSSPISAQAISATTISATSIQISGINIAGTTIKTTTTNSSLYLQANGTGQIEFNSTIYPATSGYDIGKSGNTFNKLWITGSIGAGTAITLTDLLSLRNTPYRDLARTTPAQSGDTLFWDQANGVWLASHPDNEILHSEVTGLTTGDAGHTQFVMLAGRSGGQTISGGTGSGEALVLQSTTHATKGAIALYDTLRPLSDATYSAGWSGVDLGFNLIRFRDVYTRGEFKGFRFENYSSASVPSASATNAGRAIYTTDTKKIQIDTGGSWITAGSSKASIDVSFDGIVKTKDIDVSTYVSDAQKSVWQLLDNANNFERMFVPILTTSSTNVRILTTTALPAGTYRLIGME